MIRGALTCLFATALLLALAAVPAAADPVPTAWAQLRNCESGGDYTVVAVNGHYGAYQFSLGTWRSVGGTGRPDRATPTEQDYRALYLYRMRGWQPWTCATMLHLRPDADAASKRVPTYAESAAMSPGAPAPNGTGSPVWPGAVYAYGDCATALRTWQLRMNTYGYAFDGTGCYHAKTRTAVLALQRANDIKDSGLLGPKTWRAAWQGTPPPTP
jgi:resuscitation-promoting factor RpfA